MITFVPVFVSPAGAAWAAQARAAAVAAGVDPRNLDAMDAFYASYEPVPPEATLDDVVAHLEHARRVAGIDHIGLGGDYDGVVGMPVGLEDVSCYPVLLGRLRERGWTNDELARLTHRNLLRVLGEAERVAERLWNAGG